MSCYGRPTVHSNLKPGTLWTLRQKSRCQVKVERIDGTEVTCIVVGRASHRRLPGDRFRLSAASFVMYYRPSPELPA